jgi:translation elongation factor P/translation initiation factor 5A
VWCWCECGVGVGIGDFIEHRDLYCIESISVLKTGKENKFARVTNSEALAELQTEIE